MKTINQNAIDRLCLTYSTSLNVRQSIDAEQEMVSRLLDEEMLKLQTLFRRKLNRALLGRGAKVMRSSVYALIAHGKFPVTVTPIACASILVRKGVEIHLSFVATEKNISEEMSKLAPAVHALNS